jgi:hypothetical protein
MFFASEVTKGLKRLRRQGWLPDATLSSGMSSSHSPSWRLPWCVAREASKGLTRLRRNGGPLDARHPGVTEVLRT